MSGARFTYVGAVPPLQGGIAQYGGRLISALRAAGTEVDVVTWRKQYPDRLYPGEKQEDPFAHPFPGASPIMHWASPASWVAAGRHARASDALLVPWVIPLHAPALRVLARVADRPVIVIVHNPLPHETQPFARPLARSFLRRTHGAVAQVSSSLREFRELAGPVPSRVVLHPPNLDLLPTPLPPADTLKLLCFGFVRPYKGIDVAIDALGVLRQKGIDARLTVAGQLWGPRAELERIIAAAGVTEHVDLRLGYVPDDEVAPLFATHHLVVAPYRSATNSGVVPLAFAAGRAVIGTAVGGLVEQITPGRTGDLVPPGDPHALAEALAVASTDLPRLSSAAAKATPTWSSVADAVISLADEILDGDVARGD